MKKIPLIIVLSASLFFCCRKISNESPGSKLPLTGKWILAETLADPGDGSGKWTAVDKPNYYYLQFNADSTVQSNYFSAPGGLKKYSILSDTTVSFKYVNGNTVINFYKTDNASLTLTGGCFEACGSKFKRML